MKNVPTTLMKKFELAFGFAQGERWFGAVICDEQESHERVRSGIFEGELVLISKRALPRRKVRVNSKNHEITLLDVTMDGTDMAITVPYTVRNNAPNSKRIISSFHLPNPHGRQRCGSLSKLLHGRLVPRTTCLRAIAFV